MKNNYNWMILLAAIMLASLGVASAQMTCDECEDICEGSCEQTECDEILAITAGASQPVHAGNDDTAGTAGTVDIEITDENDDGIDDTLLLTYTPAGCWDLKSGTEQFKANIYTTVPDSRPSAGQFPYKATDSYEIKIPLSDVKTMLYISDTCPSEPKTLYIVAHLDLACTDEDGNVEKTDTAFAGNNPGSGTAWWWYSDVTFGCEQTCYCNCIEQCWTGETAWAAGTRYVEKGNWATYTPYTPGSTKTVTLYAGKTMNAGTVTIEPIDECTVTITITLNEGWRFDPDEDENVHIQGYVSMPPAENPAPGQFAVKKFADESPFSIEVDATADEGCTTPYNYYGIHVAVERKCED
ncbi:MAG: hypothetical protein QXI70_07335 [Methanothrix sp.]